jgi:hypothetical protein
VEFWNAETSLRKRLSAVVRIFFPTELEAALLSGFQHGNAAPPIIIMDHFIQTTRMLPKR